MLVAKNANDDRILASPTFTFVIGQERTEHTVYAAVVARQSPALNALINGTMKEAASKMAILEDVDCGTFVKFCRFAYTGDYERLMTGDSTGGEKTWEADFEDYLTAKKPHFSEDILTGMRTKKRKGNLKRSISMIGFQPEDLERPALHEKSKDKDYNATSRLQYAANPDTLSNVRELTQCLLEYTYLYSFAGKWQIDTLKRLTLCKLSEILRYYDSPYKVAGLVELSRYAYCDENTPE